MRALEITKILGKPFSEAATEKEPEFDVEWKMPIIESREVLYDRINKRVDIMVEQGVIEETKNLLAKHGRIKNFVCTIGYQEIYDIVKSKLKELMRSLKLNSDEFINNIIDKVDTDEHIKVLVSEKNKIVTRLNTIDSIIIRLYEDLVEEKLSGSNYQKMLDKYQDEQKKLNSQLIEIESKLTQENKTEENIETFKQIARKYIDFDELTPEIINNLISHITVSHVKVINGTKFREIKIIYKFIG